MTMLWFTLQNNPMGKKLSLQEIVVGYLNKVPLKVINILLHTDKSSEKTTIKHKLCLKHIIFVY